MRRVRRGFTLIEILIAISVIVVLMAMIFLGFKHVKGSATGNTSNVSLQNLRGMLTEFEHSGGNVGDLSQVIYWDIYSTPPVPFPAPVGSVNEGGAQRFGEAVVRTQRVLRRLASVPANKSVLDGTQPDLLLRLQYQTGVKYVPGDELVVPTGGDKYEYYLCTAPTTAAPPGSGWKHMGGTGEPPIHHTPVLLDGAHNPIIFVPTPGLGGVNLAMTGTGTFQKVNQTILAPGAIRSGGPEVGVRPFFASAGEDAEFSKGDDNHYSYEQ